MAAILSANRDLTDILGLDPEPPPGSMAALDKAGKGRKLIVTVHKAGNDAIRPVGLTGWQSNWMPNTIDSGLILVTKDIIDDVIKYYQEAEKKVKDSSSQQSSSIWF